MQRTGLCLFPAMPNTLLSLPALYTIVGLYRLGADPNVRNPVWVSRGPVYVTSRTKHDLSQDKCRHGTRRGLLFASIYVRATFVECVSGLFQSDGVVVNLGRSNVFPPALVCFDVSLKVGGKMKSMKRYLIFVKQVTSPRISVHYSIRNLVFLLSDMGYLDISLQPNVRNHTFLSLQKPTHSEGQSVRPEQRVS